MPLFGDRPLTEDNWVDNAEMADRLPFPLLKTLYSLWADKKAALGHIPSWGDFSPSEISEIIPSLAVFQHDDDNGRLRIRFIGTRFVDVSGRDNTGLFVDELPHSDNIIERARSVMEGGRPRFFSGRRMTWADREHKIYCTLCVPLQNKDTQKVDHLAYVAEFS